MPALEAFGRKWRVGSDDFVFPYLCSIATRFLWFFIIGLVILTYDKKYTCDDEMMLKVYLYVLIIMHICMCLIELSVVMISARGTIADSEPRSGIRIALYVQAAFFVLELVWDIVGVFWAFDPSIDCPNSHSVLILVRIILTWNLLSSFILGPYTLLRIWICKLPCFRRHTEKLRYEKLAPVTSFGGRRISALSSSGVNQFQRQREWQRRIQCICCCVQLRDHVQQSVFSEVSATMADAFTYFRGYVPSDILAGMVLLSMEQKAEKDDGWSDVDDVPRRKLLDFESASVTKHFNRVVRYMRFAAGAYGWPLYAYDRGCLGLCKLLFSGSCQYCKKERDAEEGRAERFTARGDSCGWHMKGLKEMALLRDDDILYASFECEVFCPAFYVAYDHRESAVVVVIRGSITIRDALTDLSAEPGVISTSESGDVYAHKGMMHSAHAMQLKLESEGILERALEEHPDYRVVITGHSLGAGVASLLAILLKPKYPKLHCYAYSPPGCLISMSAVPHTRPFITSLVVGNDLVTRLSLQSFERFSERVLHCIQTCNLPKYRVFLDSFLQWLLPWCCRPPAKGCRKLSVTEMAIQREPLLNTEFEANFDEDEDLCDVLADMKAVQQVDPVTGKHKYNPRSRVPLFLPGRIIHITWAATKYRCCGLCKYRPLQAHWTAQSEFSEIIVERDAFTHHMPDNVLRLLHSVQKQEKLVARDM